MEMKGLFVFFLCFPVISTVRHSWKAFYTGSSGLTNFPEFVALNVLDDQVMGYFDSRTNRFESKMDWMMENLGKEYEEQQTNILRGHTPSFKANVATAMQRFNQTKGVHINQRMYGCEWDDETDEVTGFDRDGYDGEDFIVFDLKTETYIAPKQQAVITKNKWDNDKAFIAQQKNYYTQICPEWLKKYVNYGRSSLMRTALPSVSLLQQTPSSPVRCFASGFYPERASLFWRKDGVELHEDVELGEILPNNDGNFQMSADLKVSSITPEDWEKYECVFQLSGEGDKVTKLDKTAIKTNFGKTEIRGGEETSGNMPAIIAAVVVVALVLVAVGIGVYMLKKKSNAKCPPGSETSSEASQPLKPPANPQA